MTAPDARRSTLEPTKIPVAREGEPVRIEGGEPACWLQRVCPDCGARTEQPGATCWRCGRRLEDSEDESGA